MKRFLLFTMLCLLGLFGTAKAQNLLNLNNPKVEAKTETSSGIRGFVNACYVNFYLYDSYGDGWNGASLLVTGDGLSETLTVGSGSDYQYYEMAIPIGTYVTVDFRSGNYDSECSYTVKYDEGITIYEGGPDDVEFYVNCSDTISIQTPPAAPELTAVAEGNNIVLSWNAVEDADEYIVYKWDYNYYEYYELGTITDAVYTVIDLNYATEYCFVVVATNEAGRSSDSNMECATTLAPPAAPVLTATAEGNNIVLSWDTIGNATNYNVFYYHYDEYGADTIGIGLGITSTSFVLENVELEVEYCFSVTAVNEVGVSAYSNKACAIVYEEGTVVIGNGDVESGYLPTNIYYNYSLTQQIYTAEELGLDTCEISSIAFYQNSYANTVRDLKVFMMNNDKSYFDYSHSDSDSDYSYDWVNMNELDIVFEGECVVGQGWVEIDLDYNFVYTGNTILLCVVDNSGFYENSYEFRTFETQGCQAIYRYTDEYSYNPYGANGNYEGRMSYVKNQLKLRCEPAHIGECQTPELTATATNDSTIVLTWNDDEYASYYEVYSYDDTLVYLGITKDTEYVIEGLDFSTEYCYSVRAVSTMFGESEYSDIVCATTTELLVPEAPELNASAVINTITLSWDAVKYAASYKVYYHDVYGDTVYIGTTSNTSYMIYDFGYETEYCFFFKSMNKLGESGYSETACVTTGRPRPEAPYVNALTIDESSIVLEWDSVRYANYYAVYYGDFLIDTLSGTIDTIADLDEATMYCFNVKAINEVGESPYSNDACETTLTLDPNSKVIGDNVDGNTGVLPTNIYYNYSLTQQIYTAEELGLIDSCEISSIAFYQEYNSVIERDVKVFMMNTDKSYFDYSHSDSDYDYSDDWVNMNDSIKVFEGECVVGQGWVEIELDTNFIYTGNNILVCVVDNTGTCEYGYGFRAFETQDCQAIYRYTDSYSYNPYGANGNYEGYMAYYKNQIKLSFPASGEEDVELEAPVLAAEATNDSTIVLTWSPVEGAESYAIYYEYFKMATTTDTVFTFEGLDYDETYCFTVKAVNETNTSEHSNYECATTPELFAPEVPVLTAKANGPFEILLKWNAVEHATHYNIYHKDSIFVATVWYDSTYTVKGLEERTEYCFVVEAANKLYVSDESEAACAKTESKKPCLAPEGLEVNVIDAYTISLEWDEQDDVKGYKVYRDGSFLANTEEAEFTDTDLDPDTEYCYTVRSVCEYGNSKESEEVCSTTYGEESIEEETAEFNIYPNPVNDKLYIETLTQTQTLTVEIYDIYGRQQSMVNGQQSTVIDVTSLNSGVYFVKIITSEGETVKRFIKD